MLLTLATVVCLSAAFYFAKDIQFLAPGPLTSAHGSIENCSACHTASGGGKLGWVHSLVAGDPVADSNACLTCHKMPDTAFNAHGTVDEALKRSTARLRKTARNTPAPQWARAQRVAFPTHDLVSRGLFCSTCHREHKGANNHLSKISSEQCSSCHVVKVDSFDGHHPEFESYPFKRRTQIIYDHVGHGGKHYPEMAKKGSAKRIPATCSSCHNSQADRRIMAVAPFEQTCSSCHLGQITGKDRASGPKGIAFLTLPGLDLQALRERNSVIGEWPAASEAELTPFMKVMIGRSERGGVLIRTVEKLNLQDLSGASDAQIKAVADLVWEIKRLFYALISGKASDVLGNLNIECGAQLSPDLVADLTASLPRDVVISAQQQWLPNLGTEMAARQTVDDEAPSCWVATIGGWFTTMTESSVPLDREAASAAKPSRAAADDQQVASRSAPDADSKDLRIDPYGRVGKGQEAGAQPQAAPPKTETANAKPGNEAAPPAIQPQAKATEPPRRGADQTDDLLNLTEEELRESARPGGPAVKGYTAYAGRDGTVETISPEEQPGVLKAGVSAADKIAQVEGPRQAPAARATRAADQTDDLLTPTEDELRGLPAPIKDAEKAAPPEAAKSPAAATGRPEPAIPADAAPKAAEKAPQPPAATGKVDAKPDAPAADAAPKAQAKVPAGASAESDVAAAQQPAKAAPVISIESDIDPESWAEYGGWYRQDHTIFYRPIGHKDKFVYSWLFLTGPQAPKGDTNPAAAVFNYLTSKDAQGSCTKCHSVDDIQGKGRLVNFSPPKVDTKKGRFTTFVHEPHFGVLDNRGCLSCHSFEKGNPYLQSYAQGNPRNFASNFTEVKKELCQSCHTNSMARQDCLLCHKYHVNGVTTPIMNTRLPIE